MRIINPSTSLITIAAVLMLAAPPATAAEPGAGNRVAFQPDIADWRGFYIGGHGGWTGNRGRDSASGARLGGGLTTGGLHLGYNRQVDSLVFGAELDADLLALGKRQSRTPFSKSLLVPLASARLRAGYAMGNSLIYVTAGFGLGIGQHKIGDSRKSALHPGFVAGGGVEHALSERWSLRGEYLYAGYARRNYKFSGGTRRLSYDRAHILRAGLSYRF